MLVFSHNAIRIIHAQTNAVASFIKRDYATAATPNELFAGLCIFIEIIPWESGSAITCIGRQRTRIGLSISSSGWETPEYEK